MESTGHQLSAWMCMTVPTVRFAPAMVSGKAVVSLYQQPYTFGGPIPVREKRP